MRPHWSDEAQIQFNMAHECPYPETQKRYTQLGILAGLISIAESLETMRPKAEQTYRHDLFCNVCNLPQPSLADAADHYRDHAIEQNNRGE